jgi:chorismate mutase
MTMTRTDLQREYNVLRRLHEDMIRQNADHASLTKIETQLRDAYDALHLANNGGERCKDRPESTYLPARSCTWCNASK